MHFVQFHFIHNNKTTTNMSDKRRFNPGQVVFLIGNSGCRILNSIIG